MNILIKDIDVLPMTGEDEIIENTNLYIFEDKILHIGELRKDIKVDKIIDGKNKIAMPGLVNAHTHIGMSLLRNFADDVPLQEWLEEKIWPVEAHLTDEDIYWGSLLSMVEMIKTGTTSFCDMYFEMHKVGEAAMESGMRAVLTRGLIEDENKIEKLEGTEQLYKDWNGKNNGRITVMVAPHAPYTCGGDYLKDISNLASKLKTGIHTHLSETSREVEDSLKEKGMTPIKYVESLGLLNHKVVAAHCVHVNDEDLEIIKKYDVSPINNPSSNLKLASGFAPIDKMLKMGINVGLGTDGSSSNNNLNMFEEIHIASILNKAVNNDATSVTAYEALKMATVNGAKALGLENVGTLEEGNKADLILIDLNKAHIRPIHNKISAIAYSVQGSDVDSVIIDGDLIMENREILTLDVEKIMEKTEKVAHDLVSRK